MTGLSSPHFTQEIRYADPISGTAQYNGNISQLRWGHGGPISQTTNYVYDGINRLLSGVKTGAVMNEQVEYDDMGNISKLTRDNGAAINYSYTGNRLVGLSGGLSGSYSYDVNGNATQDRTGMTFSYNHLNLPATANKSGVSVAYLYDAAGSKLRKTATVGSTTTQRDYVGGIEYSKVGGGSSAIELIHTEEGYLQNNGGTYTYHYNLTDHLGNVRATLQRTSATAGTVIQKHDYYPFGKSKALQVSGINKYLYNGKEVQEELGNQYDYGARFYDAEIGRWNVVDPLAEKYMPVSPYSYAINNPIMFIDPDGRDIKIWYKVNEKGVEKSRSFVFNGQNSKAAPDNYFVKAFVQAYNYNIENGGGDNLLKAAISTDYTIELVEADESQSSDRSVFWNPFQAEEYLSNTNERITFSPSTILEHEFDHAVSKKTDPIAHEERRKTPVKNLKNKEEERVIKGSEQKTGQKNGELKEGQHRKTHNGRLGTIRVGDPTSTKEYKYPWENNNWRNNF